MIATYLECPQCRGRALSVATRCPHCGHDFPPRPLDRSAEAPDIGRRGTVLAVSGVVLAGAILMALASHRAGSRSSQQAQAQSQRPAATSGAAPDSTRGAARQPVAAESAAPRVSNRGPAPRTILRYAITWANVRRERARSAPAVGLLNPGDSVQVDSLRRGWYRVLAGGRAVGYVHRAALSASPPVSP